MTKPPEVPAQAIPCDLSIADDKLITAEAIANFIGEPIMRTRYLLRMNMIPHGRQGRIIYGSRRALREHYARLTSGTGAAG